MRSRPTELKIWKAPNNHILKVRNRYVVALDIGGVLFINFISVPLLSIEARNRLKKVEKIETEKPTGYPMIHLGFMGGALLISMGCICYLPYVRFPLIAVGLLAQGACLFLSNKNGIKKTEFFC